MTAPKLRFKDFEDGWEKTSFQSLFIFKNGINASKEQYGSGTKFINVLDIINNPNGITYDSIIGSVQVSQKDIDKNLVNYGDVVFQRSSETREEVGQSNVYLSKEPVVFGGFVIRGSAQVPYDPLFMNGLLKTDKIRDQITQLSGGSTRFNIGQDSLNKVSVFLPSKEEQTKIASFLSAVDEKISQLSQKLHLLGQYKQGMMQKLFSQQIRFKADDGSEFGEWKQSLLGQHCQITTGKLDANAMKEDGQYRFYTCAKDYYFIDNFAFDTEALLISGNGAHVGYIHYYKGKFNAYQRTYVLDNWKHNIQYVKYFMEKYLKARIYGEKKEGNTPYIVLATLSEMPFQAPCLEEQTKIANFLSAIDQKIDVVSGQLEQAKLWKKGLLQQMFV